MKPTVEFNPLSWHPTRWWRVILKDGGSVWCETSDEQEARDALKNAPRPAILMRLWETSYVHWEVTP